MENTDDPDKYLKIIRKITFIILIMITLASLWRVIIKQDNYSLVLVISGLCLLTGYLKFKQFWLRVIVVIVRIILIASAFLVILNNHSLV